MITVKRNCSSSIRSSLENQYYTFGSFTISFTEDEYRYFSDLLSDSAEDPQLILQAIIEEGLYSLMGGE